MSLCPNCNKEAFCPCGACVPRHGKTDLWINNETHMTCPHCMFSREHDWWLDYSVLLAVEAKQWPTWQEYDVVSFRKRLFPEPRFVG